MTNKNTNYNIKHFSSYHKELIDKWYPNWTKQIKSKIPSDYLVTDDEIYSEITQFCCYLSDIFTGGHYPSFCNRFVVSKVTQIIWKEYNKLDHSSLDRAMDDFETGYEDSYTESHQIVKASLDRSKTEYEKMKRSQLIEDIKSLATDDITKMIIKYKLEGIDDLRTIASKIGISKDSVARKLKTLKDKLNENH